ncbi:MAG: tetratricopeptide repeat protein [Candidatus Obscuribacterales bacterium]|nr:tetratricopeptide repeat protein [Candidatus Obscuribacterales bacterium]
MKVKLMPILTMLSLAASLSLNSLVFAETPVKQSVAEKSIEAGQKAFDNGSYVKAERSFKKAELELSKNANPDEKLALVSNSLGQAYVKQGKFSEAQTAFKNSLTILKGLSLDPSTALNNLTELEKLYRPIDLLSFDETSTKFAKQVGAVSASALNQNETHHIEIVLEKKFQQKLKELISAFMPQKEGETAAAPEIPVPQGAPEVKQLRLDKKITFDLARADDGKLKLANIQGISFDVGLWAKLKQLVMMQGQQDAAAVELTASAFGVDKTVKTDLPKNIFDRLKEGLDKFDPFSTPALARSAAPQADENLPKLDAPSTAPESKTESN